jgi:hypothetical protein
MEGENSQHIQPVIEAAERSTEEFRIMGPYNKMIGQQNYRKICSMDISGNWARCGRAEKK